LAGKDPGRCQSNLSEGGQLLESSAENIMRTCHHYPKRKYHMELITLLYQIWGAHPDKTEFPCVRQKYPKCTIFAASDQHPKGFVSVENAFSWPTVFLRRLADKFGQSWVCERINSWSWSMSTAFSGIGAAESV